MTTPSHHDTVVIATHNASKLPEMAHHLGHHVGALKTAGELGLSEPEETGRTYIENAELKARIAAAESGLPAIADDSGFEVAILDGKPGLYSHRWADAVGGYDTALPQLLAEAQEARFARRTRDRRATFQCAVAIAWPDGRVRSFQAELHGTLADAPRGDKGVAYDAIFIPNGDTRTFGEMEPDEKHAMSHRAKAMKALVKAVFAPAPAARRDDRAPAPGFAPDSPASWTKGPRI